MPTIPPASGASETQISALQTPVQKILNRSQDVLNFFISAEQKQILHTLDDGTFMTLDPQILKAWKGEIDSILTALKNETFGASSSTDNALSSLYQNLSNLKDVNLSNLKDVTNNLLFNLNSAYTSIGERPRAFTLIDTKIWQTWEKQQDALTPSRPPALPPGPASPPQEIEQISGTSGTSGTSETHATETPIQKILTKSQDVFNFIYSLYQNNELRVMDGITYVTKDPAILNAWKGEIENILQTIKDQNLEVSPELGNLINNLSDLKNVSPSNFKDVFSNLTLTLVNAYTSIGEEPRALTLIDTKIWQTWEQQQSTK